MNLKSIVGFAVSVVFWWGAEGAGLERTPVFTPGLADHTEAIQASIDEVAKAGGGTVWIPPGEYRISTLALGEGVTLKFAGGVEKATDGYTEDIRKRAMDPKVSAIVRTTGKSVINMFVFNMRTPGYVTNGASNVAISGGVFDCEGRMKVLAFLCAKNARIENMLVRDLPNDHAIQLDNCSDAVVSNCLFAGYTYVHGDPKLGHLTRETVQVEPTRPGAIWKLATSPIRCEDKDNWPCRNVTIADCWFGPSENLGSQLVAIGHHVASRAGDGVRIVGNVIVDPRHCALRLANYSDVVVAGNRFVYTRNPEKLSDDASVVLLWGESRLGTDERGFVFLDNAFDLPAGFNLPMYTFAPGREKETSVDPVVTVTLTFDDGTRDHLKAAALLEKYGWRGCFNIITDKVGDGRHLTWDEIRDLKRRGHEIASHTASHPSLKKLLAEGRRAEALDELVRSRDAIAKGTGSAPHFLCHPYIAWNDEVDALIRETGMTPYGHVRYNHGKGTKAGTPTGVGAYLDRKRVEGKLKVDLLFHGVEAGGGWNPIDSIDDFEAALKEIKAREAAGSVQVLPYGEFAGTDAPSAETIGRQVVRQFLSTDPTAYDARGFTGEVHNGTYVPYAVVSLWVNALEFARKIGDGELERTLLARVEPFLPGGAKADRATKARHVDFSVFGALPLEKYILDGDKTARTMGLRYADRQWEPPQPGDLDDFPKFLKGHFVPVERQLAYLKDGYSGETRLWIDDMYMINLLQTQAYRATKDHRYIDRAAKEMCLYLDRLQLADGLFHHAADVPFVWGRGDGWMAAGMPMILRYLDGDDPSFARILAGYRKMMATLLKWQRADGLWGQLVTDPESWSETSGSAMFAYGMLLGVKRGWLDKTIYAPAVERAWRALVRRVDADGNLADICIGTGARNDRRYYLDRSRLVGDPHGQAALLWLVNELIGIR